MFVTKYFRWTRGLFGERGDSREAWQWQPTTSAHDPSPPITLENAAGGAPQDIAGAGAIASAEAFGQPLVAAVVSTSGIASTEAFGSVNLAAVLSLVGIATAEQLGAPAVQAVITAAGIPSAEALGAPAVTTGHLIQDVGGIASSEAIGQPSLSAESPTQIAAGGIRRRRVVRVSPGYPLAPLLILPDQAVIGAGGIASSEAIGRPTIELVPRGRPRKVREEEWLLFKRAA